MNSKPKLRTDTYYDFQSIIVDAMTRIASENHIYRCCYNCLYVDLKNDQCGKWKVKPPIEVISFGCDNWEDKDVIPF